MPAPDPLLGTQLGPCRLDELIGLGGMGRVYKARHLALDRAVAVKLVDATGDLAGTNGAALREQILAEARSAAKFEDPRIVAIHEVGEDRGIPYIVMQWVDGESLEARVKRLGRLSPEEALEIIRETAAALGAAHKAGLVHRDIKPGNILIDARAAVKLADFGIARPAGAAAAPGELAAGSFHFMAPEQAFGAPPDPRSDLYALGATWYYALTGQPPYPGSSMDALVRHRDEPAPEVRLLRPEVTERAAGLLRRLMAKPVTDRPADAFVLLKELASPGMLLETDASGSPFKILPAVPRPEPASIYDAPGPAPSSPAAAAPVKRNAPLPLAPPPPAPAAELGSKSAFIGLLAVFGVVAFGWQWRRAGPEDWAAGAALLALVPAALTYGDRRGVWSRAFGAAACLGALACWAREVFGAGVAMPALEPAIAAAVGAISVLGASYLGQWSEDRSDAAWARVLGPGAAACLLASALTWTAPESQAWTGALAERFAAWWGAFSASGGAWRWLGTAGVFAALGAAVHLKVQTVDAPARRVNWNK
ncbi:MAG: serine/threonine-protein kinase [Elusimicrobiota bacterium]|nr:serine/threonine-protein kinase [Elusimicrobiota bacterium]